MKLDILNYRYTLITLLILTLLYFIVNKLSTTEITAEVSNNHYQVYVNGRLLGQIKDTSFSTGSIKITPLSLGLPGSVVQTKIIGTAIYDLNDRLLAKPALETNQWENYRARISISGIPNLAIHLHRQENNDGIVFIMRSFYNLDYGFKKIINGKETLLSGGNHLDIGILTPLSLLTLLFLQSYPYTLILLAIFFLIQWSASKIKIRQQKPLLKLPNFSHLTIPIIVSTFLFLIFINTQLLGGIPHVPDSVIYLMQAKIFAHGKLYTSPPIFKNYYQFFDSLKGGMIYRNGKWFSQYPFGHPLLLSIGQFLGIPWLISPIVGTLFLFFLFLLSKNLFGQKVALLVLLITIISPFFQTNAANFMSHNSASFYLIVFLFFFFRTLKNKSIKNPIIASISFGLLFNTRILTASVLFVLFFIFSLFQKKYWDRLIFLIPGGILFLLLYFGYNAVLTGNPFLNPYQLTTTPPLGFNQGHTLGKALLDAITNASIFFSFAFGWPQKATLIFALIALILPPFRKNDMLFFFSIISIVIAWLWFDGSFVMYGPRYYYEMLPFILLLTGSGIDKLIQIAKHKNIAILTCVILLGLFSARLTYGWILGKTALWQVPFTPTTLKELKGFNYIEGAFFRKINSLKLQNALVFVKPCSYGWWCDAPFIALNSPNFDGEIVWTKDLGEKNKLLKKQYPSRKYFLIDYETKTIKSLPPEENQ